MGLTTWRIEEQATELARQELGKIGEYLATHTTEVETAYVEAVSNPGTPKGLQGLNYQLVGQPDTKWTALIQNLEGTQCGEASVWSKGLRFTLQGLGVLNLDLGGAT